MTKDTGKSKSKGKGKARDILVMAGDVGGTRARFALFDAAGETVHQEVLGSREFDTFEGAVTHFLSGAKKATKKATIAAATFGIAGPVVEQRVKTTNLPWVVDAKSVSRAIDIPDVTLLNDLVAVGFGAIETPAADLEVIHIGRPKTTGGNLAVIAAGTGLGEAAFVWDGSRHVPCPTEGAHVDFAPRTPIEAALWEELVSEYGHVSYERVASGSTIHVLYNFFVKSQRIAESKANAARVLSAPDPNVAVVELAERGKSEAAMRAVELWAAVYGAEASNLALKTMALSGVFVCGGASVRLASVLAKGLPGRRGKGGSSFVEAFRDKGRMRSLVERIPIAVVNEPLAGLLGAASHARARI